MALLNKVPTKIVDGRQAWTAEKIVPCTQGPDEINNTMFNAGSLNTSNLTFNVQVPSLQTGVNRRLLYHLTALVDFTGTPITGQTNLLDGVNIGLSDSFADQIIANERILIGSKSNNVQRSQVGVELNRINRSSKYDLWANNSAKDFGIGFSVWNNTNRNVLAKQYDFNPSDSIPAPRTTCMTILSNTPTTAQVLVDMYFFSAVSPFSSAECELPAIRNLDAITCTLQFESDWMRLFSYDATQTGLVLSFGAITLTSAQLNVQFITPSPDSIVNFVPEDDYYDYKEIQFWSNPAVSVSANQNSVIGQRRQVTLSLQQVTGSVIPDLFIIAARPAQNLLAQSGAQQPRFWLPPSEYGIKLKFNNQSVLDQMSNRQLYEMCVENGLSQMSLDQFLGRDTTFNQTAYPPADNNNSYVLGGGFICVDPSKDFQIARQGLCNGALSNWSLSGQITFENQSYEAEEVELVVIAVYPGWLLSNGAVQTMTGLLTKSEVVASFMSPETPLSTAFPNGMGGSTGYEGGKFSFGDLLKGAKKVYKVGKSAYDAVGGIKGITKGIDQAKNIAQLAGLSGAGYVGGRELKRESYKNKQVASKYL